MLIVRQQVSRSASPFLPGQTDRCVTRRFRIQHGVQFIAQRAHKVNLECLFLFLRFHWRSRTRRILDACNLPVFGTCPVLCKRRVKVVEDVLFFVAVRGLQLDAIAGSSVIEGAYLASFVFGCGMYALVLRVQRSIFGPGFAAFTEACSLRTHLQPCIKGTTRVYIFVIVVSVGGRRLFLVRGLLRGCRNVVPPVLGRFEERQIECVSTGPRAEFKGLE